MGVFLKKVIKDLVISLVISVVYIILLHCDIIHMYSDLFPLEIRKFMKKLLLMVIVGVVCAFCKKSIKEKIFSFFIIYMCSYWTVVLYSTALLVISLRGFD